MMKNACLMALAAALAGFLSSPARGQSAPAAQRLNVLLITMDDMNCDSVGVFGCKLPDTTPNMDRLASQGVRFDFAQLQVANCKPSRNVMQTGRYPHTSGVEGFYPVKVDFPILPDLMKQTGYFTAIIGKVSHTTPGPWEWDLVGETKGTAGIAKSADYHHDFAQQAIEQSKAAGKPFYLLINITDPHMPHYGSEKSKKAGYDNFAPSKLFPLESIPMPGYLPDLPESRLELKQYYDSVRRGDDQVGATLRALDESGEANTTVVLFLSDNGMPFPFAKTCLYQASTHTPWMARWPGVVKPGTVDSTHMISTIDFAPTVLDIVGLAVPPEMQGRSFAPLLRGQEQDGRDMVFKEYNENSGGHRNPMRAVQTRKYLYIFNAWADGQRRFYTATQGTQTYHAMVAKSASDPAIAERLHFFDYRVPEEMYDVEKDPDNLHNLIDDPALQPEIERLRKALDESMVKTADPCLEAFRSRANPAALEAYMTGVEQGSKERKQSGVGKPAKTKAGAKGAAKAGGPAKAEGAAKAGKKQKGGDLFTWDVPTSAPRSGTAKVVIHYTIPDELGEQTLQVTVKSDGGAKLDRKIVKIQGKGDAEIDLAIPNDPKLAKVTFAAFVGKEFTNNLQYLTSPVVPVQ
ncbi:MAG: sulfatase [Candidatus Sumerlaeota bacterium]|nr:sulfatase [Candidatus Sumerlaeota bacterium]